MVGRTGSGKTSLFLSILDVIITEGSILLDGLDIKSMGTEEFRSKVQVIPQDPLIFQGTIRNNLNFE